MCYQAAKRCAVNSLVPVNSAFEYLKILLDTNNNALQDWRKTLNILPGSNKLQDWRKDLNILPGSNTLHDWQNI